MLASGPSEPRLNFSFNETHFLIASPPGKTARRVMRTRASTVNIAEFLTERHTGTTALFMECLAADKAYPCDNLFYSHKNRIKLGLSFFNCIVTGNCCQLAQVGRRSPVSQRGRRWDCCARAPHSPPVLVVTGCTRANGGHFTLF